MKWEQKDALYDIFYLQDHGKLKKGKIVQKIIPRFRKG